MNSSTVRVRFAPSPTGFLHLGGARTALVNWLYARHTGGTFVLRIEDTDRARSTAEMTDGILDGLRWLGLDWDEGPFHQADGASRHQSDTEKLIQGGHAYRCFCPPDQSRGQGSYRYPGTCRHLSTEESHRRQEAGESSCVRFLVPPGRTTFQDLVHGPTAVDNEEIEDFILIRSDASPTYQISCVSDDTEMKITHVIRGDDHLSNTPKQILLYQGLGVPVPIFGHLPLIFGPDRKKLSKRHGAISVTQYREQGFLPAAMINYLALLGWSPGDDREVMTRKELVQAFSLQRLNRSNAIFDPAKLEWFNGQKISTMNGAELLSALQPMMQEAGLWEPALAAERQEWFLSLLELLKPRARTLPALVSSSRSYLTDDFNYEPEAVKKHLRGDDLLQRLSALRSALGEIHEWQAGPLEEALRHTAAELGVGAGKLIHPTRLALTGSGVSPGLFEVMVVVGREQTLKRLQRLESHLSKT